MAALLYIFGGPLVLSLMMLSGGSNRIRVVVFAVSAAWITFAGLGAKALADTCEVPEWISIPVLAIQVVPMMALVTWVTEGQRADEPDTEESECHT